MDRLELIPMELHLLERRHIKNIRRTSIIYQDLMSRVVKDYYFDHQCIIVWLVYTHIIFICECYCLSRHLGDLAREF